MNTVATRTALVITILASLTHLPRADAQWDNRYAKLSDFGHHVYLEQHELPAMGFGPSDPAPAPDGQTLAFAAQGWLWLLNLKSGKATRLTDGPHVDARPRWSADGKRIAFVRDDGLDTSVVVLHVASGDEAMINTPTIELDPEFSADGTYLFYTSGRGDRLSLWRRHLASGTDEQLTDLPQVERNARSVAGGSGVVYLHGAGAHRVLRYRNFLTGDDSVAHAETLTYHLTADAHPSERLIVYSAPIDNAYHLWTMDLDDPRVTHRLTHGARYATLPAFSADGTHIYYVEPDDNRQFGLWRIRTYGGAPEAVTITEWDYGTSTGHVIVDATGVDGEPVTARISIVSDSGHPVASPDDATYFDPQTGRHYFYVEGRARIPVPIGGYTVTAARGPLAPIASESIRVQRDAESEVTVALNPLWNAAAEGYASADHHVHLNGDGHHPADHEDALRLQAGEDLDVLTPMSWNRWERRIDEPMLGKSAQEGFDASTRIVEQGQEVRSHFHGHIGLNRVTTPFAPWFFGPNNPTLGDPDLTNGDVLAHAAATGAFATYVHPIGSDDDPFEAPEQIPLELVSDGILAPQLGLEIVCAWTSPLGNAQLWYRLLNIGRPVAAMSGTDGWVDFHRTPAAGTGRTYVRLDGQSLTADAVLNAAIAGRSFVTTGPALRFSVGDGVRPGEIIASGRQRWQAILTSTMPIDRVEIIVNGTVVEQRDGVAAGETRTLEGTVTLPEGGWIAARAYASERQGDAWPTMHARPFAHASPIWIEAIGSTEPGAKAAAAEDLRRALTASEARATDAYGDVPMARLKARFEAARRALD